MTANQWKIELPLLSSFKSLLEALEAHRTILQFKAHNIPDVDVAVAVNSFVNALAEAEKILKIYLLQLIHVPVNKKTAPSDVIKSFEKISGAWLDIPVSSRGDFISTNSVQTYEDSIVHLLSNTDALMAARKDLKLSVAEIADEIK